MTVAVTQRFKVKLYGITMRVNRIIGLSYPSSFRFCATIQSTNRDKISPRLANEHIRRSSRAQAFNGETG